MWDHNTTTNNFRNKLREIQFVVEICFSFFFCCSHGFHYQDQVRWFLQVHTTNPLLLSSLSRYLLWFICQSLDLFIIYVDSMWLNWPLDSVFLMINLQIGFDSYAKVLIYLGRISIFSHVLLVSDLEMVAGFSACSIFVLITDNYSWEMYTFRKIPRDLTEASLSGAGLSIVAAMAMLFLFGMVKYLFCLCCFLTNKGSWFKILSFYLAGAE